jgi:hypothetical protein
MNDDFCGRCHRPKRECRCRIRIRLLKGGETDERQRQERKEVLVNFRMLRILRAMTRTVVNATGPHSQTLFRSMRFVYPMYGKAS